MSEFRQQQEEDEAALELLSVINRVASGMGGQTEALILASALGLRSGDNKALSQTGGDDE